MLQKKSEYSLEIHRIQACCSIIMCRYFCIWFTDFMLRGKKGKSLLEYKDLFSPCEYKNNNKIKLRYF